MKNTLIITLGSSSISRQNQLDHYKLPYNAISPNADETLLEGEPCKKAVQRICQLKQDTFNKNEHSILITADQMLEVNNKILGKPLTFSKALEQLMFCSGQSGIFHSAMMVWSSVLQKSIKFHIETHVKYAQYEEKDAMNYLKKDTPENCAGSIKIESLGLTLMEEVQSTDPTAIVGLPMLSLFKTLSTINLNWRLLVDK